jgi:hypothetical protein
MGDCRVQDETKEGRILMDGIGNFGKVQSGRTCKFSVCVMVLVAWASYFEQSFVCVGQLVRATEFEPSINNERRERPVESCPEINTPTDEADLRQASILTRSLYLLHMRQRIIKRP